MKRMKSWSLFVGVLFMALLCMAGCSKADEDQYELSKSIPYFETGLKEGPAYHVSLEGMTGAAMYQGEIYVCNKLLNNVTCYQTDFTPKRTIGKVGSHDGELLSPEGIWVDDDGIHVLNWGNKRIEHFAHDGTFIANYPIIGTYSLQTLIGGFCRTDGQYWISLLQDDFTCKLLIVPENGESKLLDADGMGDFFVKDGIPYLFTRWGTIKEGREKVLDSNKSGEIYQCSDEKLVKVNGGSPEIIPTPLVPLGNWYFSLGIGRIEISVYSRETFECLGYAMKLSDVGTVDPSNPGPLQDIRLLSDGQTLYFLWPADHKVYTWTRSAT